MKKIIGNILITSIIFFGIGSTFAVPKVAYAACGIGVVTPGNSLTDCVNELVVITVMPIVGKFLQLSAYLFDHALTLNMNIASFLQKPNCTTADCATSPVEVVWKLIRDISGMFFIFILVWASIKMILGGSNSKSVIVGVVLAGLLVNFSLFATKLIIDASNSLTLTVYSAITPEYNPTIEQSLGYGTGEQNKQASGSISTKIMQVVKLQSLYASTRDSAKKANFNVTSIVSTVGGIVLMLVLALAFLAAGLMFLWRFVMLLVLMAFSPLPALALAFPQLQSKSKEFMKKLLDQCLFAPIFLFFIYIALKVMTDPAFIALANPSKNTFANVFAGGGAIGPLVQYGIMVTIIYTGLLAAKSYGGKGADFGINGINWLSKMGQGAIRNTGGFAGQHSFGRLAKGIAGTETFKNFASNNPDLGVLASGGLKKVSGATFGGTKGGYDDRVKKYVKARTELAKKLELPDSAVEGKLEEFKKKTQADIEASEREIERKQDYIRRLQISINNDPEEKTAQGRNAKKEEEKTKAEIAEYIKQKNQKIEALKNTDAKKKEFKNERTMDMAKRLKSSWNPITGKADDEAAKAIEKEIKKGKKETRIAELADLISKSDEKEGVGEKPKEDKA
ncbi:MAG: hypothetical protein KBD47_01565 [Candidatus Pacebacteria bacterium]|nr:hypothetical protein [Candidatus Paceibacterota bacterium]